MAKLIIDGLEHDLPDGSKLHQTCENVGIPFSCTAGDCGTCQIEILEGANHLNHLSNEEIALGMDKNFRLACQCVIKSGVVKISY